MGGWDVLFVSAFAMKYADQVGCVSCRVIPNGDKTGQFVPSMEIIPVDRLRPDFSKSVNSFGLAVFFRHSVGLMLSNRGAKSRNEFTAAEH